MYGKAFTFLYISALGNIGHFQCTAGSVPRLGGVATFGRKHGVAYPRSPRQSHWLPVDGTQTTQHRMKRRRLRNKYENGALGQQRESNGIA